MKNKKGFTFVELIAVITIIGILTLIALPTIEKLTKTNKEKVYQQQLENIVLSLKSWASDNRIYLPEEENDTLVITLGNLKSDGYIEYEVKNPLTGKCFDNGIKLIITKVKKNYDYAIDLNTIKESNNCEVSLDSPVIALNGSTIENVEVNSAFVDKGVIAKDKDGNNITDQVITTISGSGNVIDTSKLGNIYVITYSVTINEEMTEISRTVKIVDTTPPEIVIPGDVFLETSITSFNIMNGVSATDNSGEQINVSTTGNIKFGNVGKYTITYKATDSSNNTITKKRIVTIGKVVNRIMASNSNCIKDTTMVCPNGTEISVQVNATQTYDFYVIKDTGTKLTLIMNKNLGSTVAWYKDNDNDTDPNGGISEKGPITALNYLNSLTSTQWTNIPEITSYEYKNNPNDAGSSNTQGYQKLVITNGVGVLTSKDGTTTKLTGTMRARLLTKEEAYALRTENSNTIPTWLNGNLYSSNNTLLPNGYWFLTVLDTLPKNALKMSGYDYIHYGTVNNDTQSGVRPVIEISK